MVSLAAPHEDRDALCRREKILQSCSSGATSIHALVEKYSAARQSSIVGAYLGHATSGLAGLGPNMLEVAPHNLESQLYLMALEGIVT